MAITGCSAFAEHDGQLADAMLDLSPEEWIAIRLSLKIALVAAEWLARRAGTRFHGE